MRNIAVITLSFCLLSTQTFALAPQTSVAQTAQALVRTHTPAQVQRLNLDDFWNILEQEADLVTWNKALQELKLKLNQKTAPTLSFIDFFNQAIALIIKLQPRLVQSTWSANEDSLVKTRLLFTALIALSKIYQSFLNTAQKEQLAEQLAHLEKVLQDCQRQIKQQLSRFNKEAATHSTKADYYTGLGQAQTAEGFTQKAETARAQASPFKRANTIWEEAYLSGNPDKKGLVDQIRQALTLQKESYDSEIGMSPLALSEALAQDAPLIKKGSPAQTASSPKAAPKEQAPAKTIGGRTTSAESGVFMEPAQVSFSPQATVHLVWAEIEETPAQEQPWSNTIINPATEDGTTLPDNDIIGPHFIVFPDEDEEGAETRVYLRHTGEIDVVTASVAPTLLAEEDIDLEMLEEKRRTGARLTVAELRALHPLILPTEEDEEEEEEEEEEPFAEPANAAASAAQGHTLVEEKSLLSKGGSELFGHRATPKRLFQPGRLSLPNTSFAEDEEEEDEAFGDEGETFTWLPGSIPASNSAAQRQTLFQSHGDVFVYSRPQAKLAQNTAGQSPQIYLDEQFCQHFIAHFQEWLDTASLTPEEQAAVQQLAGQEAQAAQNTLNFIIARELNEVGLRRAEGPLAHLQFELDMSHLEALAQLETEADLLALNPYSAQEIRQIALVLTLWMNHLGADLLSAEERAAYLQKIEGLKQIAQLKEDNEAMLQGADLRHLPSTVAPQAYAAMLRSNAEIIRFA